jgi:tripartite-type tricarboxylate transporter receptor subunit TctC
LKASLLKASLLFTLGTLVLSAMVPAAALAAYPDKPVTIIVPYPAGGGTDTVARKLARTFSLRWKTSVIVENVPGAEGLVGSERVLRAPADGYTLLFQISQMMLWKKTMPQARVNAVDDFRYVSKIQTSPLAFGVSPKLGVKTLADYVTLCKSGRAECSWGSGSAYAQLIGKQLMDVAGIPNAINIPYKGTAPMMTDVAGGHITMAVPAVTSSLGQIQGGLFQLLAVGSDRRSSQVPNAPTLAESGYKIHGETWYGLLVAKKTPQAVVDELAAAVSDAAKDTDLVAQIRHDGGEPVFSNTEDFTRDVIQESKQLESLLDKYWTAQ